MANKIDSKITAEYQQLAKKILTELNLNNMLVTFDSDSKQLVFTQDRRTVSVPLSLAKGEVNEAVRFLFRAILTSPNSKWNRSAETNDWGGKNHYK